MDDTELTDISGVGSSTADALREAGYDSVSDVAMGPLSDLEDVSGLGDESAPEVAYNALTLLREREQTPDDESDDVDTEPDLPVIVDTPDGVDVSVDIADEAVPFVQHALFAEFIEQHTRRHAEHKSEALACAQAFETALRSFETRPDPANDAVRTYEFMISEPALTTFYRALSSAGSTYAEKRGISRMYGQTRHIASQLNEYR